MLREMDPEEWLMWQTYAKLEPFGEERADMRMASIDQTLVNLHRDRRLYPDPFPLINFLLGFGDQPVKVADPAPTQTLETIELHLDVWCATQNLIVAAKADKQGS